MPLSSCSLCTSRPAFHVREEEERYPFLPHALALIAAIGGIFLLLASFQVLPAGANPISNQGDWVIAAGFFLVCFAGISAVLIARNSCDEQAQSDQMREEIPLEQPTEAESAIDLPLDLEDSDIKQVKTLSRRCANRLFFANQSLVAKRSHPTAYKRLQAAGFASPKGDLGACIGHLRELFDRAEPIFDQAKAAHRSSAIAKKAAFLMQEFERVKENVASMLVRVCPNASSPPPDLDPPIHEALKRLDQCWREKLSASS